MNRNFFPLKKTETAKIQLDNRNCKEFTIEPPSKPTQTTQLLFAAATRFPPPHTAENQTSLPLVVLGFGKVLLAAHRLL